jgi:hypothetical protein
MSLTAKEVRERGDRLRAVAEELKGKPCEWGVDDCSMLPARWVSEATGKTFDWPDYSTKEEAHEQIEAWGGLVNIWNHVAAQLGLKMRVGGPEIGDVGIIQTVHGPVGGIFLPGQVIMRRAEMGVRVHHVPSSTLRRVDGEVLEIPLLLKVWQV